MKANQNSIRELESTDGTLRGLLPQRALERLRSEALAEEANRSNPVLASRIPEFLMKDLQNAHYCSETHSVFHSIRRQPVRNSHEISFCAVGVRLTPKLTRKPVREAIGALIARDFGQST
jgi:hypothetical protein